MNIDELIEEARDVRQRAYAPYSGYRVGAAVLDEAGRIWSACNVENISFGLTVCAERAAVARLVAEGGREVRAIVVATVDGGAPCGMCLQTLVEFASDPDAVQVVAVDEQGVARRFSLKELIPYGFSSAAVRTNG